MDTTITTYVEYLLIGSFVAESDTRAVTNRDPGRDAATAPHNAFAFRYFDIATTTVNVGGNPVPTRSGALNPSPRYYIDAQEMTCADVEALPGDHWILLSNMRGNGWDLVLRCRTGYFQPKERDDVLINTGGAR